jgi:hypothetical protein
MSASSDYLEAAVLNHVLRNTALTSPTTVYVALFTSDDSTGGTSENLEAGTLTNEVTTVGTAYARQSATFAAPSGGSCTTSATITFPAATANYGTVTHVAVMDGDTEGSNNVLMYGSLDSAKTIESGDTFQITAGNLTVSLA